MIKIFSSQIPDLNFLFDCQSLFNLLWTGLSVCLESYSNLRFHYLSSSTFEWLVTGYTHHKTLAKYFWFPAIKFTEELNCIHIFSWHPSMLLCKFLFRNKGTVNFYLWFPLYRTRRGAITTFYELLDILVH